MRAFPHVEGMSRRFKAAPTKLTRTAAAMMGASGVFSTSEREPNFRPWRFAAAALLLLTAATLAIAGDQRPASENARGAHLLLAHSDAFASLGVGDYAGVLCEVEPAVPPAALDAQDTFEVERMFRLSGAR